MSRGGAFTRLVADVRPLRDHPAFRRMWAGGAVSNLGGNMTSFAVVLQIWDVSHSSLAVGALGLAQFIPVLVFGLVAGSLADAADRRRLYLIVSSCLAVVSGAFAAQAFAGNRQLWLLYALAVVQAVLMAVSGPARRAIIPRLIPKEQLTAALALNVAAGRVAQLAGPALAGGVTAAVGLKTCYLVDALSYGPSIYATARLAGMPPARDVARPGLRAAAAGLSFICRTPVLAAAFLTDLDAMLFGLPVALFPALNEAHFGGSPQTLGLLNAAVGAGGVLTSVLSGSAGRAARQGLGMLAGTLLWGAAIAGFGLTRNLPLALGLLAVAGAADTLTVTFRSAMVQAVTPEEFRGRVSAVEYVIGVGGGPLGNFEAGGVAALTSPVISAVSGGIATIAVAMLIAVRLPAFTRYRAPASHSSTREDLPAPT